MYFLSFVFVNLADDLFLKIEFFKPQFCKICILNLFKNFLYDIDVLKF